jgi:hypothetical protein
MRFQKFASLTGVFSYCMFKGGVVALIELHSDNCKEPEITLPCVDNNLN